MTSTRQPMADPTQLLRLAQGGPDQPGSNLGQYITAAMLAAAQDQCSCETCKLIRQAGKLMRAGLVAE